MAGRPKSEDPSQTYTLRLNGTLLAKFKAVAVAGRRRPTELLRLLVEDAVSAYEQANGPIVPPVA